MFPDYFSVSYDYAKMEELKFFSSIFFFFFFKCHWFSLITACYFDPGCVVDVIKLTKSAVSWDLA